MKTKRVAEVGMQTELVGWGAVEVVEIVVGDYRRPERRYVRCATATGERILSTEAAFLKAWLAGA